MNYGYTVVGKKKFSHDSQVREKSICLLLKTSIHRRRLPLVVMKSSFTSAYRL